MHGCGLRDKENKKAPSFGKKTGQKMENVLSG